MPDDGSAQSQSAWPVARFQFQVNWDGNELLFQEVTGLNAETQVIEYRDGNSKVYAPVKMPGIQKFGNITLKKGMFKGDTALWKQFTTVKMNTYKRSTIVINLLDENNAVAMSWNLTNAFPSKITVTDMKADANEAAVESMEIAHEGLTLVS